MPQDPPTIINGIPVEKVPDSEMEYRGETWITLRPIDEEEESLWEFSITTGRLIKTR